ncbi:MAG: hypothetical protein IPG38_18405 [Chitinophagaceae bacterium]|nr:hypothetical protein [Chitinophagaceae bacterium]
MQYHLIYQPVSIVFANTNYYPPYGIAHETVVNNNTNLIRNGAGAAKRFM